MPNAITGQNRIAQAAEQVQELGLINNQQFAQITNGSVSQLDLSVAKATLGQSSLTSVPQTAETPVEQAAAQQLFDALDAQINQQGFMENSVNNAQDLGQWMNGTNMQTIRNIR